MKSILVGNKQNRPLSAPKEDIILWEVEKVFTRLQNAKKIETLTTRVQS
jgi:hypothetical protein